MDKLGPVPQPGILEISPYVGGESKVQGIARPARLASNENPLGPSASAMKAYSAAAAELHRYPDGSATALREAIGRTNGLDPARIVCGAGSDELFALLATAYAGPGDEVLHSWHGFLAFPIVARSVGATPIPIPERNLKTDVEAVLAKVGPRTRMIFLANPNNPTGSYLSADEIEQLLNGLPPHVLLVLDAAYGEFVNRNDYSVGHEMVDRFPNAVVTHTFSKIYALAAVRLGWAYCPPAVADVLNRIRQPFNVGIPAMVAGVAALEDPAFLARSREHNERWRPWLAEQLTRLGFTVYPSVTNFLLVSFKPHDAEEVRQFLKGRGVLVRQMGAYGLPDCLRITIGTEEEMRALISGIEAFLKGGKKA
ncbi:MAG TPA: histidinol-phosphate transaminase [Alphaproteobacteria bacterium]|nr:histidinol-phosphate transaminase [Alphaproteobacteria bacterium]